VKPDYHYADIDKQALYNALLALHTCPHCRADLLLVGPMLNHVYGCATCRETWFIKEEGRLYDSTMG